MAQHSYFNLGGHASGNVLDHELTLPRSTHAPPIDSHRIPHNKRTPSTLTLTLTLTLTFTFTLTLTLTQTHPDPHPLAHPPSLNPGMFCLSTAIASPLAASLQLTALRSTSHGHGVSVSAFIRSMGPAGRLDTTIASCCMAGGLQRARGSPPTAGLSIGLDPRRSFATRPLDATWSS